jgi:hypothetical protein
MWTTSHRTQLVRTAVWIALFSLITWQVRAQSQKSSKVRRSEAIYEDSEIRLTVLPDWNVAAESRVERLTKPASGVLVLERGGYRLKLAYHTDHASGIIGGRFVEAFDFGWPGLEDPWNCSLYLQPDPQPVSRRLILINLILDTGDEKVQQNCGIPRSLGFWHSRNGTKEFVAERRWFGAYFTPAEGEYFWGGNTDGCGFKSYTLTPTKSVPGQFPDAGNPILGNVPGIEQTIRRAIDIVNSIQYKRCSPF